jgi:hypothetical protein
LKEHLIEAVNRLSTELGYNPSDASPVVPQAGTAEAIV